MCQKMVFFPKLIQEMRGCVENKSVGKGLTELEGLASDIGISAHSMKA